MDIRKLSGRFASSSNNGEGHLRARENSETPANPAIINTGNLYSSNLSTPIKTSFGLQAQSRTPASKLAYLSANGCNKEQSNGAGWKAHADAVNNRTPLRLLGANNKNGSLFSPSPLERLCSPTFKGKARRVFILQPELLASPRRVPVKQKSSEAMTAVWQSPFSTPNKPPFPTPSSNKALQATCQKDDGYHHDSFQRREDTLGLHGRALACTPQRTPLSASKRVGHVLNATCQKHNLIEHHDAYVKSTMLPKRMLAFTCQQSPRSNMSNRKYTSALPKEDEVDDGIDKHHYGTGLRDDDIKLERLAHLKLVLASSPLLSMSARRVPVRQKPKQQSKEASSQHDKKKPPKNISSSIPDANRTNGTKAKAFDVRKESADKLCDDGVEAISVGESRKHDPSEEDPDQSKQLDPSENGPEPQCSGGLDEVVSKQHDAREGTDEAKQNSGDDVDEISVRESMQHDTKEESTDQAKRCGDSVVETSLGRLTQHAASEESTDAAKQKDGDDVVIKMSVDDLKQHYDGDDVVNKMSVDDSKQHDIGRCVADLNILKKRRCAIKDTVCSNLKRCGDKKASKISLSETPMGNAKQCEGKKPTRKIASSLETLKGCKTGQARVPTCRNHGKTVDAGKKPWMK